MFVNKDNLQYILGIETSCDDTSIAIYNEKKHDIITISSSKKQSEYGGVVPELAARFHESNLLKAINKLFKKNKITFGNIKYIAYTSEPGLKVCLNMGKIFASSLSFLHNKPLVPVNHLYSHLFSFAIEQPIKYPFVGLIISGGHTAIYLVKNINDISMLNNTLDDAVGEVYDKVGRKLNLKYPCGPEMDKMYDVNKATINFLNKKIQPQEQFSFSGIKSQVLNYIQKNKDIDQISIISSLQKTIMDIVVDKVKYYCNLYQINNVAIGGGVAANNLLRTMLQNLNYHLMLPPKYICGDNVLIIGSLLVLFKSIQVLNKNFVDKCLINAMIKAGL